MDIWQILFNSQANTSSSKTSHVWDEATYSASDGTHLIQILSTNRMTLGKRNVTQ